MPKSNSNSSKRIVAAAKAAIVVKAEGNPVQNKRHRRRTNRKLKKLAGQLLNVVLPPDHKILCDFDSMSESYVFADGGMPGNPPWKPPSIHGRPIRVLSIKNGDLHVPIQHLSTNGELGLTQKSNTTGETWYRLVPRNATNAFSNLGDPLCDAMDAVFKVMPSSSSRGQKIRVVREKNHKYVCFGPCAARGHTGINSYHPRLVHVNQKHQHTLMTFAYESDNLRAAYTPTDQLFKDELAIKTVDAPTFHLPAVKQHSRFIGSWAMGVGVVLNMHQDLGDFIWSNTSVHVRGPQSDRILCYFC